MHRLLGGIVLLAGVSLYGASLAQSVSASDSVAKCNEVPLTVKPGWTLSGAWRPDGSLLVVDALWNRILRYSKKGESLGSVGEPLKSALRDLLPVTGQSRGSEFIVEISDGLMLLDQHLRPRKTFNILASRGHDWEIGGYWQWQSTADQIVAYVDLVRGTDRDNLDNWRSAFVRFSLDNPATLKVLRSGSLDDRNRRIFFRTGSPLIASLDSTAYILSLGDRVGLFKNAKDSAQLEELTGVPPDLLKSPRLPEFRTSQDYVDLMAAIEKASMPVGLYAWNKSLYILSRSPKAEGTRWVLTSISPARGEVTGSAELPIHGSHVVVVPGDESWAFLEKGPVKGYGVQTTSHVLLIPSPLLKAPLPSRGMICR